MLTSIIRPASYPSLSPKKGKNETYILFLASRIANQAWTQLVPPQANLLSNRCPEEEHLSKERTFQGSKERRKGKNRKGEKDLTRVPVSGGKREEGLK